MAHEFSAIDRNQMWMSVFFVPRQELPIAFLDLL